MAQACCCFCHIQISLYRCGAGPSRQKRGAAMFVPTSSFLNKHGEFRFHARLPNRKVKKISHARARVSRSCKCLTEVQPFATDSRLTLAGSRHMCQHLLDFQIQLSGLLAPKQTLKFVHRLGASRVSFGVGLRMSHCIGKKMVCLS